MFTGHPATISIRPAGSGRGIRFYRMNGHRRKKMIRRIRSVVADWHVDRHSNIGRASRGIQTVEHLMSALNGMGVTNLSVELEGPEIPALDGSALEFVRILKKAGLVRQSKKRLVYRVKSPLFCSSGNALLYILPHEGFKVTYTLDYPHPRLKEQTVSFDVTEDAYIRQIAPARTFCTEEDAVFLKHKGLGKGATYQNTLVMTDKGPKHNRLKFPDECARHKVLDLIGDLGMLGFSIHGHVIGIRSGHALNRRMADLIMKQKEGAHD